MGFNGYSRIQSASPIILNKYNPAQLREEYSDIGLDSIDLVIHVNVLPAEVICL